MHRCLGCGCEVVDDVLCVYCDIIIERMPEDAVWSPSPYGPIEVGTFRAPDGRAGPSVRNREEADALSGGLTPRFDGPYLAHPAPQRLR